MANFHHDSKPNVSSLKTNKNLLSFFKCMLIPVSENCNPRPSKMSQI